MNTLTIIGLGYIGIPTAVFFANNGVKVQGFDINENIVNLLNLGKINIVEPGLEEMVLNAVKAGNLVANTVIKPADAFIISVPTPFKENHQPDLKYIESAVKSISTVVKKGDLIVLESTSPVGTTEQVATWLQEYCPELNITGANNKSDVYVAYCPERMIPGNVFELVENDRIIGGINPESTQKAIELYSIIAKGELLKTNSRAAEMSKLTENSYRDVNIAFANELSIICDRLNIDVQELIELANHHPRVNILQPGCGVGGHCIAVDPWFIISKTPEQAKLIKQAREVNDYKPQFVIEKVEKAVKDLGIDNAKITCFGLAFKPNIDDLRESPALQICKTLAEKFSNVSAVEPNISVLPKTLEDKGVKLVSLEDGLNSDVLVMLVEHKEFKNVKFNKSDLQKLIDTRGIWK